MAIAITVKKQMLLLGALGLLLTVTYVGLRWLPAFQKLQQQATQLQADKQELAHPRYPEVPDEDPEELQAQLDGLMTQVTALQTAMQGHLDALSTTSNQDLILRISEIARANGVKVTENVPYVVPKAQVIKTDKVAPATVGLAKTKTERKRQRKEKRAAMSAGSTNQTVGEPEGTLIYQLVNSMSEPRPMQAMTLEGSFFDLKSFLQALSSMPAQITVARIDINTKSDVITQGMPQGLQVKMILAM